MTPRRLLVKLRLAWLPIAILGLIAPVLGAHAAPSRHGDEASLKVWLEGEPGQLPAFEKLLKQYEALHPKVKIKYTFVGSNLFNPTLLPALNAGTGPDIWSDGTGPGQPKAIIDAGHALNLTPYYCKYGWSKRIPREVVLDTSSHGKLWAIGDAVETTMMFYNKKIFAKSGVSVPKTWTQFLQVLKKLKAAGYETVIGLGGQDKWPISHWQSMLWGRIAGPKGLNAVMFGNGSWNTKPFVQATSLLEQLNKEGYFGPNPNAVAYDPMMAKFWRGDFPMTFTGPWVIPGAIKALGSKVSDFGVFQIPSIEGKPVYPTLDIGTGWYINSKTKNPDAAADLLNFILFRPSSRKLLLETGTSRPVGRIDLTGLKVPALLQEMLKLENRDIQNGTIHAFLDTVTPDGMTQASYDGLQALIANKMTPAQLTASVETAWKAAKAKGQILGRGGVKC